MPQTQELTFTVLLFGGMREALHADQVKIKVSVCPAQTVINVADLLDACATQFPAAAIWLPHLRVAVNQEYASLQTSIDIDDEVALIPPIAGGYI